MGNTTWDYVPFCDAVDILDNLRKPINSKERQSRIAGKQESELYPYYGATGQVGYIDDYLTDGEYVLLGEDGAPFLDAYAKKAYIISGKTWVNNHAHILRSKTDNKFLCYYLNSINYKDFVSGTTRYKLTQQAMKKILVPVPPLEEQQRIVARIEELFSELDAAVATLERTKEQLAVYRQAVYGSFFSTLKDMQKITEFFDVSGGLTKNSKRSLLPFTYPYLRVANVYYNHLDLAEVKEIGVTKEEIRKCELKTGDLLFVEGNGSKSQIGRVAVWDGSIKGCLHQNHLIKARPKGTMLSKFALYYFMSGQGRNQILKTASSTSGLYTLSTNKIKNLYIPTCQKELQETIVSEIESRLSVCDKIEETVTTALQEAEAMRQSILKQAFAGEL